MRAAVALVRASWRSAASYRVSMALSIASLAFTVVPVYFVAQALQPLMAESIRNEGQQYFGFVLVGTAVLALLATVLNVVPNTLREGIRSGFFEALLVTPQSTSAVVGGQVGFDVLWSGLRTAIMLLSGWLLGASMIWSGIPTATLILLLTIAAYFAISVISGAMILAFRTVGPLPSLVVMVSGLFGGVYWPTQSIPGVLERFSAFVPLTYGLRAFRRVLFSGASLNAVRDDVLILTAMTAGLWVVAALAFHLALRYARRSGSLSQY